MITWSPGATVVTPSPTSSTMPAPSWPRTAGGGCGIVPFMADRSEWHTPECVILTLTSPGPIGPQLAVVDDVEVGVTGVAQDGSVHVAPLFASRAGGSVARPATSEGEWAPPRSRRAVTGARAAGADGCPTRRARAAASERRVPVAARRRLRLGFGRPGQRRNDRCRARGAGVDARPAGADHRSFERSSPVSIGRPAICLEPNGLLSRPRGRTVSGRGRARPGPPAPRGRGAARPATGSTEPVNHVATASAKSPARVSKSDTALPGHQPTSGPTPRTARQRSRSLGEFSSTSTAWPSSWATMRARRIGRVAVPDVDLDAPFVDLREAAQAGALGQERDRPAGQDLPPREVDPSQRAGRAGVVDEGLERPTGRRGGASAGVARAGRRRQAESRPTASGGRSVGGDERRHVTAAPATVVGGRSHDRGRDGGAAGAALVEAPQPTRATTETAPAQALPRTADGRRSHRIGANLRRPPRTAYRQT